MKYKYLIVFSLPILTYISLTNTGWITFLPLIVTFFLVPLIELFLKPNHSNYNNQEELKLLESPVFDWILYSMIPIQFFLLWLFLDGILDFELFSVELIGRILAMGLMCGVIGINVAHELGHRVKPMEQKLAKLLLLSSLYQHFFIEHNQGHHKNVGTINDPATARKNEWIYFFWVRTIITSIISAWNIEIKRLKRFKKPAISINNQMIQFTFYEMSFLIFIYLYFGSSAMIYFMVSAFIGILLLETVNYIEHYGLYRKKINEKRFENTTPSHSWNSDHQFGRMMLFELTRHSDHHYEPSRKYQVLRHHKNSPQLPTGYPGMMLLSLVPPLWFKLVNPLIEKN